MSAANHLFLPWVQPRTSATAPDDFAERLTGDQAASVRVRVDLAINTSTVQKTVRLHGPGDVTGIDPLQIVRLEPQPGTTDFEPNYFPFVEFDRPDFPWLFSSTKADAQGRLRPWLVVVVIRKQPGVQLRPATDTPLPVIEIAAPAKPGDELPDLAESHFWAHAQITGAATGDIASVLASDPARTISRVMCARRLKPAAEYLACVVPAFDVGRAAGLNQPLTDETLRPAWLSGDRAPSRITLPVYYSWEFRTSDSSDFEALARRLQPHQLPPDVGKRPIDVSHPGFALTPQPQTGTAGTVLGVEGALRVAGAMPDAWPDAMRGPLQSALANILNTPWQLAAAHDVDPIVAPPIYGAWHAAAHHLQSGGAAAGPWVRELNLDPRHRIVAAMGTAAVQVDQEALMASAWQQLGDVNEINQRLRQAQLSRAVNERYHARAFARFSIDSFARVIAPAQSRILIADGQPNSPPVLLARRLARSFVPATAVSPNVRKLSRPRGRFNRQYAQSGIAGAQAMFTWFNQPPTTIAPGIRGEIDARFVANSLLSWVNTVARLVWVLDPVPHWERMPAGFMEMIETCRNEHLLPSTMGPGNPARVPAGFPEAARAHQDYLNRLFSEPVFSDARTAVDAQVHAAALANLSPDTTVSRAVRSQLQLLSAPTATGDDLDPIMDAPTFARPMYEALRDLSPESVFPGLDRVPPDTVQVLQTNAPFIEAFMVGLNTEMARELLWRGYPTDQRGTYFQQFWDTRSARPSPPADIPPIHRWGDRPLGGNMTPAGAIVDDMKLVLLIRSELLRRYPGVVIYAVKAVMRNGRHALATDFPDGVPQPLESHPLFRGSLGDDVTFVGFDLTRGQVAADPGWFVVLQQQPTEPRFGLDDDPFGTGESGVVPTLMTWNDLNWAHLAGSAEALNRLSHLPVTSTHLVPAEPVKGTWGRNAAHMALITKQRPVRVAIHAAELLHRP
jgi:hypothetical protein